MKVNQLKMIIREVVREEIQLGLKEIIGEINQPTKKVSQPQPEKKIVEKKSFTSNSVLNDVLNYGDMMNSTPQQVPSSDPMSQFLNKDYRQVLTKAEEKDKRKYGR